MERSANEAQDDQGNPAASAQVHRPILVCDETASNQNLAARAQCPACFGHGEVGLYQCWRCRGHGSITADYPVELSYPAGLLNEHVVQISLTRFGIDNFYLTVRFRVTGTAGSAGL